MIYLGLAVSAILVGSGVALKVAHHMKIRREINARLASIT